MDGQTPYMDMLNLIAAPCFCVKDGVITACNAAADRLLLPLGNPVRGLLVTGKEEYADFQSGSLYLTLELGGTVFGASVARKGGYDFFLLEEENWNQELTALALAAKDLRSPLAALTATTESLSLRAETQEDAAHLNRSIARMLRILGNMSAAANPSHHPELLDISALFAEVFQKAAAQLEAADRKLIYQDLPISLYTLADPQELERAALNLLSNAAKFSPPGSEIRASLTRRGRMLYLTVQNSGEQIPEAILGNVFHRYLRQPAIEDGRYGIGLGLVLVRSAAAHHGGTVLIDSPGGVGTRVTLTLAIRQDAPKGFRSPILRIDYSGERDHGLIELSDVLPADCYREF